MLGDSYRAFSGHETTPKQVIEKLGVASSGSLTLGSLPEFLLTYGTNYGSNGAGLVHNRIGSFDDIQLRSWGIQLVDGRMPGFAAIIDCARSNEEAVSSAMIPTPFLLEQIP